MTFVHTQKRGAVSVLLPVRDAGGTLDAALESIKAQDFNEFEVIAVDHRSRDDSYDTLRRHAATDSRITLHRFEGDRFVDCLNFGLSHCRGEFIARMDADDLCRSDRLTLQTGFLKNNRDIGIVGSAVTVFGQNGVGEGYRRYEEWINGLVDPADIEREMFVESPLPHPSIMLRRSVLEKIGWYRDFDGPEDYDLWLRARAAGIRMAKVPEPLLQWRDSSTRLSRRSTRYARTRFHRLRAFYLAEMLRGRPIVIQGAGTTGRWIGKFMKEQGAAITAYLDINPRKIGGVKLGLPVHSIDRMPDFIGSVLVSAVSSWGARELIREKAREAGFVEGVDFFCAS